MPPLGTAADWTLREGPREPGFREEAFALMGVSFHWVKTKNSVDGPIILPIIGSMRPS